MKPSLSPHGRLRIEAAELSTEEVDNLIHDLAVLRNEMEPPVPNRLPSGPDARVTSMTDPSLAVSRAADGLISVMLRHQGFGWIAVLLSARPAAVLRDALHKRLPGVPIDLAAEQVPDGHGPKH